MPSGRSLIEIIGISSNVELIMIVSFGMLRSLVSLFSFTWDGNVQEIWNLPGPEPSFSVKYHLDYWIKNVLSLVLLFRNFTTHLHLIFYIVMLYPVLTGKLPRLMLPWLYLQMIKNIVTDVICTVAGVLLCWILHSCGLMALEFLVVQIISMMPSIYSWRHLRSYYFDLYYAELDEDCSVPVTKASRGPTLAQRRRATKSLDGAMPKVKSSGDRSRGFSCFTYDEFFRPADWEEDSVNKISKSLTTLLTIESQDSDDAEVDPTLEIIDDRNLTPAEKTLKILGLTREEIDPVPPLKTHKASSMADFREPQESSIDVDHKISSFSATGGIAQSRTVRIQARPPKPKGSNKVSDLLEDLGARNSKGCQCCEKTRCVEEDETDSGEESIQLSSRSNRTIKNSENRLSGGKPFDCCDLDRKRNENPQKIRSGEKEADRENVENTEAQRNDLRSVTDSKTVPTTTFGYSKNDSYPNSRLQAVVERDGIAWENLKEINFVSVINKSLFNELKPFKLDRDSEKVEKGVTPIFEDLLKDGNASTDFLRGKENRQTHQSGQEIIPEREDGTKFIDRRQTLFMLDDAAFSGPTSASFGAESDILALDASHIFEKKSISEAQSSDSSNTPSKQLIRPDHDTGFDSYFKSSFQRHSNMFDDTRAQLVKPLGSLRCGVSSSIYQVAAGVSENSRLHKTEENFVVEKTDGNSFYKSRKNTSQYRRESYDSWDFSHRNFNGSNSIEVERDAPGSSKFFDSQTHCNSLISLKNREMNFKEKIAVVEKGFSSSPTSLANRNNRLTQTSRTPSMIFKPVYEPETLPVQKSNYNLAGYSNLNLETIPQTREKSFSKETRRKSSEDEEFLVSLSRSSRSGKCRETPEDRETKEMEALKAYNEKTLFKYKREMDARNCREKFQGGQNSSRRNSQDKFQDRISNLNSFNLTSNVPSVPELEKPEKELILKIENAYGRFTRSKPSDLGKSGALHGNSGTKDFLDIYNGDGRFKKESHCKTKGSNKTGMRKQHSKYSKLTGGTNQFDVNSRSCKRIEGSQKGHDLDRTIAKENIRAQNIEVYFLERQVDDKPSTSENVTITTIKSFSRKNDNDAVSTVSSMISTPDYIRSPFIEVLNNPEEIPCRIEDSEYYRQLRKGNVPKNVKQTVDNIDWSFQRPLFNLGEENLGNTSAGMGREGMSLERQDIVHKTTENILQSIFANGENSERGFRLGESENEVYPIFNTVAVAMGEIVRAAALRGYTDEFISQPSREIEIPEVESGNFYGLVNSSFELGRRSHSGGLLRCSISPDDTRALKKESKNQVPLSITTSAALDLRRKKQETVRREKGPADRDETRFIDDEEASYLLSKLITSPEPGSAEINVPLIGPEDVPEEPEDVSGDLPIPEIKDVEDYSAFLFKESATPKKSSNPSRRCNLENSLQVGLNKKGISSEQVRSALQNLTHKFPAAKIDKSDFEFDASTYQGVLGHFNAGGNEIQRITVKFVDQFPNFETFAQKAGLPRNFRGLEFMAGFQTPNNSHAIKTTPGEIMSAEESEETQSNSRENASLGQNEQSEKTTEAGTSSTMNFENMNPTTSTGRRNFGRKEDRDIKENNSGRKVVVDVNCRSNSGSGTSSLEEVDKPSFDEKKFLLNSLEENPVPLTNSEMINRSNFRREVIDSAFVQAIKQSISLSDETRKGDSEIVAANRNQRTKIKNESLPSSYEEFNEIESRSSMDVEPEVERSQLSVTDYEQITVRPVKNTCTINADNIKPDTVLRNIETAAGAIKRVKSVFEEFFAEGQSRKEIVKNYEKPVDTNGKVSSPANVRLLINGELQKLQNLVQTIANYVTVSECSSANAIKSAHEIVESDVQRGDLNTGCGSETSNNFEEVPNTGSKNVLNSNTDDSQGSGVPLPKSKSSQKNVECPVRSKNVIDRFSSWDKVIPSSTRRLIAKNKRKNKSKKVVAVREPHRRVVKVVKLVDEENLDFFSARSVPQRGRGLSSGYLMDSDSDGNFTVSRPLTPDSVESETSQNLSCKEKSSVFSNPLKDSEIFPMSDTLRSCTTNRPMESCWSSSSVNPIKEDKCLSSETQSLPKNLTQTTADDVRSLQIQESLEMLGSLLLIDPEVCSTGKSALLSIVDDDKNAQNAFCNEEFHVLGVESLSTGSDLHYMTSVEAADIESKLKDVVRQILSHKFRETDPLKTRFRIVSKNTSFTSISHGTTTDSSTDLQSNSCNPEVDIAEKKKINEDCEKRVEEIMSKPDDTLIERLDTCYKGFDSKSANSDAIAIEVLPQESEVCSKNAAIGTEYNIAVFKDLLDIFGKMCSIENKGVLDSLDGMQLKRTADSASSPLGVSFSKNSIATSNKPPSLESVKKKEEGAVDKLDAPKMSTSYDSFESFFSHEVLEPSCDATSISNHTFFEEFPEQFETSFQSPSKSRNVADKVFNESINFGDDLKEDIREKSLEDETSVSNSDKNNCQATGSLGSKKSVDKSKADTIPKKKRIPRPVKGSKERKSK